MRMFVLLSAALILGSASASAATPNVVSAVEVAERGGSAEVTIRASNPPSFTTFSLVDPPRFVIDLSEAVFEGTSRKVGGAGAVKEVNVISFGEAAYATARVTVTFFGDVEPPDVKVKGNQLVVRIDPRPGTAVAAAAPPPPAAVVAPAPPPVPPAPVEVAAPAAVAAAPSPPPPAPVVAAAPLPTAPVAPAAGAAAADAEQARARQQAKEVEARALAAEADAKAAAEARAAAEAKAAAEARAAADAKAAAEARALADAKFAADAKVAADARALADAKAAAEASALADAKVAADARALADAKAAAEARAQAQAAAAAPRPIAPAPTPTPAPTPAPKAPKAVATPSVPNQVEFVGFKQLPQGSRVFVRTRTPPRFSVSEPRENLVRVEFPNTRVPLRNDLNFLDTSYFPTAVAKITPVRSGRSYVLEIQLRERVAWQQRLDGDTLSLDFDRPAAAPAPAAPAK